MERHAAVLGISSDFHDSAAAVVIDGTVVAAAEEERFTRVKHDPHLPKRAVEWCLEYAGVTPGSLDVVAFYEKPLTAYERTLVTASRRGPRGFPALSRSIATWSRSRLWIRPRIEMLLERLGHPKSELLFAEHHQSHAAAAFYPSPFDNSAVLTFDGVGEWATTRISHGSGPHIEGLSEQRFPDSLGMLYSTMTAHCGFEVNDGEQKLMALAPFGRPTYLEALSEVVDCADDGSVRLDMRSFGFETGGRMGSRKLDRLLDGPPRPPGAPVGQREADIARSVQDLLEERVLAVARTAQDLTGERRACLSGGVALNCIANGRLLREGPFDEIWVQPAAGDAGSAVGAALWAWHEVLGQPRAGGRSGDAMNGSFLGPAFDREAVRQFLDANRISYSDPEDEGGSIESTVAGLLADGAIVGWFTGRMEFGPRALGHRSILADPRSTEVATRINDEVKRRESFQPFAPAVLAEAATDWFDTGGHDLPYMGVAARLTAGRLSDRCDEAVELAAGLSVHRSELPACTHVDLTARVQTVDEEVNPEFHVLLRAFFDRTGCPVLLNTSFNGRGEPIVCTPADAVRAFDGLRLDALALEGFLIEGDKRMGSR